MNKVRTIRNEDVNRVLVGVPKGHMHRRIYTALQNGLSLIFQEATIPNIIRVYTRSRPTSVLEKGRICDSPVNRDAYDKRRN